MAFESLWSRRIRVGAVICFAVVAVSSSVGCGGCGGMGNPFFPNLDGEPDGEIDVVVEGCRRTVDCDAGEICISPENGALGFCERVICQIDDHCDSDEVCDATRGLCLSAATCDPSDEAACEAGALCTMTEGTPSCVAVGDLPVPDACELSLPKIVLRDGAEQELFALGTLAGVPVPHAAFSFSADVATTEGATVVGACASLEPCLGTLTILNRDDVPCGQVDLTVHPRIETDAFRVVVLDAKTMEPVQATIALASLASESLFTMQTNAFGVAVFESVPQENVEAVSAFSDSHTWTTYVRPATHDVVMFLEKTPDSSRGAGVRGSVTNGSFGDILVSLSGTALSPSGTELDLASITRQVVPTEIVIDDFFGEFPQTWSIPIGMEANIATYGPKVGFVATGDPGKTVLWSTGGSIRLADSVSFFSQPAGTDRTEGGMLKRVFLDSDSFGHALTFGLELEEEDLPEDDALLLASPFAEVVQDLETPPSLLTVFELPRLPCLPESTPSACVFSPDVLVMTGVIMPARGIVPLAFSSAADGDDENGRVTPIGGDFLGEIPFDEGQVPLFYAPPHDGLEGHLSIDVAFATDLDGYSAARPHASALARVMASREDAGVFENAFVAYPRGKLGRDGVYEPTFDAQVDFSRLRLSDQTGHWDVYFPPRGAPLDLVSLVPAGFEARTAAATVKAFILGAGYLGATPATYTEVVAFNGTDLNQSLLYIGGWATSRCEEGDAQSACVLE